MSQEAIFKTSGLYSISLSKDSSSKAVPIKSNLFLPLGITFIEGSGRPR